MRFIGNASWNGGGSQATRVKTLEEGFELIGQDGNEWYLRKRKWSSAVSGISVKCLHYNYDEKETRLVWLALVVGADGGDRKILRGRM